MAASLNKRFGQRLLYIHTYSTLNSVELAVSPEIGHHHKVVALDCSRVISYPPVVFSAGRSASSFSVNVLIYQFCYLMYHILFHLLLLHHQKKKFYWFCWSLNHFSSGIFLFFFSFAVESFAEFRALHSEPVKLRNFIISSIIKERCYPVNTVKWWFLVGRIRKEKKEVFPTIYLYF